MLEHQTEGYFNNQMLISKVNGAIKIFKRKYPEAEGLFIFDHVPTHVKQPEDALNANECKGWWEATFHEEHNLGRLCSADGSGGTQKGMKMVLEQRGVKIDRLNAGKFKELLRQYEVNLFIFVTFHGKPGIQCKHFFWSL